MMLKAGFKKLVIAVFLVLINLPLTAQKNQREFYQLTIYHFATATQEKSLDDFLGQALLPALHRQKINMVGVFKPLANDTAKDKTIYMLIPLKNLGQSAGLPAKLAKDGAYQKEGNAFINAPYNNASYTRMENILLQAFTMAPKMQMPALTGPRSERIYELRSYESATEKIYRNKLHMFNEGDEIGLFKRLGFNVIFYGDVVAGSKMPNLMYMTSFDNKADRDAHWKAFGADAQWKELSSKPEYKNNVSHIDITFMHPTEYSDY